MLRYSKYESYFSLLIEIINKFIPFREALNVIKIALKIIKSHIFALTASHWYFLIFITFIASVTTIVILYYLQRKNSNSSILRHIKLRHNWVLYETPEYPKYCTQCSGIIKKRFLLMRNYEGWQCLICKRISHMHCIMQSDSEYCKDECSSNYFIKGGSLIQFNKSSSNNDIFNHLDDLIPQQKIHFHVLLKGNLHSGAICSTCKTVCFSPFGLYGQKCIWCNRTYHDECAENNKIAQQQCDLGTLKYIILPPNSFVFELYSLEKNENSALTTNNSASQSEHKTTFNPSGLFSATESHLDSIPIDNIIKANLTASPNRRSISHYIQIFHKSILIKKKIRFFDDFLNTNSGKPLLVFVNTKSGGHLGQGLIKNLNIYLNPIQVVDIQNSKGPDEALILFKQLAKMKKLMILVCGGDGTVRWVIDRCREIYGVNSNNLPPIAVLPLGTGNDLSRTLGWDVTFNGDILNFLKKICTSNIKQMDIWTCTAWDLKNEDPSNSNDYHNMLFSSTFINYLDIGIAARIALKFHNLREAYPQHFKSRLGNQLVYGEVGFRDFFNKSIQLDGLKIFCDGKEISISNHAGGPFSSKSEESINSLGNKLLNDSYFQGYYSLLIMYKSAIKKYIDWLLISVADILGFKTSLFNNKMNKNTFNEINSHNSKENKLEGLIICNIPSFSGGVNLWKISNQIFKKPSKKRDTYAIRRTTTLTSRKIGKGLSDRSMSFSIDNFKNSGYLSCSNSESSECDEMGNTQVKLKEGRRRSTNLLKSWFSKAFKQGISLSPQLNDSEISDEDIKLGINKFQTQKIDDGLIEVVGIRSLFHLTQLQVGLTEPIKLCQGSNIIVYIPRQLPFQVDGEPRIINKCKLIIEQSGKIPVICSEKIENALSLSVQNALEQAVQKKIINSGQRTWITEQIIQENKLLIS
ncbi:diacylglycerol kinase [Cryptosporidium sp. chipmunk genotype I]|uniref:diacylglycerol kinase n=1 Tax=Cryptosporidium sp. chipmunk genotype I TaxID=1280935 RepID=UPI00351A84A1|nr:diacylglycerol kinase [Cryptosporidium sp. chipmunk genotype I]